MDELLAFEADNTEGSSNNNSSSKKVGGEKRMSLGIFEEYFEHVADQDTGDAETSSLACQVLVALEYQPSDEERAQYVLSLRCCVLLFAFSKRSGKKTSQD